MRTGKAELPLHTGRAPRWLFSRMKRLARALAACLVEEHGTAEFLRRLADPFWFQAFGCVLGFDWHSSGLTTTVGGALKEGLRPLGRELGLYAAGGKGRTSRRAPSEIMDAAAREGMDAERLVHASRMSAKVDSAALQDGYQLYHHLFVFTREGSWAVVQQGMSDETRLARRYHWLSDDVVDFVEEPHSAICSERRGGEALNMVASESAAAREASAEASREHPERTFAEVERFLRLPRRHRIRPEDIDTRYVHRILLKTYERQPGDFEALLGLEGVGAKTIRALALISELVHGAAPSWQDPARFAFAHGGKDRIPFPVDRATYDRSIGILASSLDRAKLERTEKVKAFRRLDRLRRSAEK